VKKWHLGRPYPSLAGVAHHQQVHPSGARGLRWKLDPVPSV